MSAADEKEAASGAVGRDDLDALFRAWRNGQAGALDALFSSLYTQMHALARRQAARGGGGETLRTTAVLHEAYLRLAQIPQMNVQNRDHFISLAARAMRFVLVDHARKKLSLKQGGDRLQVTINTSWDIAATEPTAEEVLLADQALEQLEQLSQRQAQVFELRAFGGLTVEEIAELLQIARETVKRDWQKARAFVALTLQADRSA